jgi:hypothetical protein
LLVRSLRFVAGSPVWLRAFIFVCCGRLRSFCWFQFTPFARFSLTFVAFRLTVAVPGYVVPRFAFTVYVVFVLFAFVRSRSLRLLVYHGLLRLPFVYAFGPFVCGYVRVLHFRLLLRYVLRPLVIVITFAFSFGLFTFVGCSALRFTFVCVTCGLRFAVCYVGCLRFAVGCCLFVRVCVHAFVITVV